MIESRGARRSSDSGCGIPWIHGSDDRREGRKRHERRRLLCKKFVQKRIPIGLRAKLSLSLRTYPAASAAALLLGIGGCGCWLPGRLRRRRGRLRVRLLLLSAGFAGWAAAAAARTYMQRAIVEEVHELAPSTPDLLLSRVTYIPAKSKKTKPIEPEVYPIQHDDQSKR